MENQIPGCHFKMSFQESLSHQMSKIDICVNENEFSLC